MTVEEIAKELDKTLMLGQTTWELLLHSALSPFSPSLRISKRQIRRALNYLLIGDIASGKSSALWLVHQVAPKSTKITRATLPSLEGIVGRNEISEGLIEKANNGVMVVPEFGLVEKEFPLLREALDSARLDIYKRGHHKSIDVNISFIVGANPRYDFWKPNLTLRDQIAFKQGVISRFDVLVPLAVTPELVDLLVNQVELFSTDELDLKGYHQELEALSQRMAKVKRVEVSGEQSHKLKEAFLIHNRKEELPTITLRDLETLARLVNTISAGEGDELVQVSDDTVDRAIELFESVLQLKERLGESQRRILSIEDTIMMIVARRGEITVEEIKIAISKKLKLCCARTVDRKLNRLAEAGLLIKEGLKQGTVKIGG